MVEPDHDARLRALLRLGRQVSARHDLDDVLGETFRELRELVEFTGGSIQLIDDEGWISVAAADPPIPLEAMQARVPLGKSVAGRVVLTEQAVYVADTSDNERTLLLPTADWAARVRSYVAAPLLADGRAIGVLRVDHERENAFSDTDRELLVAAAIIVAAAIQNARSYARSTASRSRAEALERRITNARSRIAAAHSAALPAEIRALLRQVDAALGDPPVGIDLPIEAPRTSS